MLTPRFEHCMLNYAGFIYALGGAESSSMECERFDSANRRWEAIPPLPYDCLNGSAIESNGSIFVLGGSFDQSSSLDAIQMLSTHTLTWRVLDVRLPKMTNGMLCFNHDHRADVVYFLIENRVYALSSVTHQVQHLVTLSKRLREFKMPCRFINGTLFCSSYYHGVISVDIAELG